MKATNFKAAILVILMAITIPASAVSTDPVTNTPTTVMSDARGEELISRLNDIKAMDKSDLSRTDKKELRKEVKAIKKELAASGRGVYLSVGAIIIVILLLILLV